MSTGYFYKDEPLENIAATLSSDNYALKQMFGGNPTTFTLTDKNFKTTDTTAFIDASVTYNKGTWGIRYPEGHEYYNQGVPIPFMNPTSIPTFYLSKSNTGGAVKTFPPSTITSTPDGNTQIKCFSPQDMIIKHNPSANTLTISNNNTSLLSESCVSSNILLDVQAPGGSGGTSSTSDYDGAYDRFGLGAGGGGGSGGFASLSANLANTSLNIKYTDNKEITISDTNTGHIKPNDSTTYTIYVYPGGNGGNGSSSASFGTQSASSGGGGAGGEVKILSYNTTGSWQSAKADTIIDNIYIIDTVNGNPGSAGANAVADTWNNIKNIRRSSTPPNKQTGPTIKLSSADTNKTTCTLYGKQTSSVSGKGENADGATSVVVGGGGGGCSLMANGGSHPTGSPGIGAGGYGASAWTSGLNSNEDTAYNDSKRINGGAGAIWLYYKQAHKYGDWTIADEPTCTYSGKKQRVCTMCNKKEEKTIDKLEHNYNTSVIHPTATTQGYTIYTCKVCGYSYNDDYTNPLGYPIHYIGFDMCTTDVSQANYASTTTITLQLRYVFENPELPSSVTVENATLVSYEESTDGRTGTIIIKNPIGEVYITANY